MAKNKILYLSKDAFAELDLSMLEIIEIVEESFIEKAKGNTEMPPKPGIHPTTDAFIHAMPACIKTMNAAGLKWIGAFPGNKNKGLPYITGILIMNDPDTGLPIMVSDAGWITSKRTGAVTAITAKYLAKEDSEIISIIGCGVEGHSNLEALIEVLPSVKLVKIYDVDKEKMKKYIEEMEKIFQGIEIFPCSSPKEAVINSDVVVTATPIKKEPQPIIEEQWFKEGALACPIDFDSYWKPEAMHAMDRLYTDDVLQMEYYKNRLGYFKNTPNIDSDLAMIISGKKPSRTTKSEKIMCINLGLAIEDIAVGRKVYDKAVKQNLGILLDYL